MASSANAAVQAAKAQLRCLIKDRLASLTPDQRLAKSAKATRKLLQSDHYRSARRISVYLSMPAEEVATDDIVGDAFDSGRRLFVPRYCRGGAMEMLAVADRADLQSLPLTSWGIRQPGAADAANREDALAGGSGGAGLDLILVPGLAFTSAGCRLGRGMGYYDRYLRRARSANPGCRCVALAFREQLVDELPTSETDQLVDEVITD